MSTFHVDILAADKPFYRGECQSLQIPIGNGQYGILAGHRNAIAAIVPGTMHMRDEEGREHIAAVSEGMVKTESGAVLLLIDSMERPEEIDANRARREAEEAREVLLQKASLQSHHAAQAQMARALNRLRVKEQQMVN